MIIDAEIAGHCIHRMYVDGGSALEILYKHCFNRLRLEIKNQLIPATAPLIGFSGEIIWPIGQIQLLVNIRDEEHSTTAWMNFVVVRSPSPYNGIIGRPGVRKLQAVLSIAHGMLVEGGMLKKHDGSWRMCVDFKDLNKACPKDGYLLPEIDWKVESLCGFSFKCFLDAYKGYHQIQIAKEDEEKTSFITSQGIFCYTKMPFGLRNTGATDQNLVDKAFHKQIRRILEVYVDDLVIKRRMEDEIVRDIEETFKTLREVNMKLNPKKRTFGVEEEMFLGYTINSKGLKVCQTRPRLSAKGQILADFILERLEEEFLDTLMEVEEELPEPWIMFDATKNEAGYEALIDGLRIAEQMGVKNLQANVDSRLVANQVNGTYIVKEADMIRYLEKVRTLTSSFKEFSIRQVPRYIAKEADMIRNLEKVRTLTSSFKEFSIRQVPRSENKKADALSKIASTSFAHLSKQVLVNELKEKSICKVEILAVVVEEGDTWMTPIFKYLTEETLPADVKEARAVRHKSQRFVIINETLYKNTFLGPWLRCVGSLQANYVLREIHEGSCSMHSGTRSIVALRIGYYWPKMHKDARTLIRACQDRQVHKPVPRNPQQQLTSITSPWPFYK
ncbi:reverse transcriptase domain-containing protein [Tanacetum coccineum]